MAELFPTSNINHKALNKKTLGLSDPVPSKKKLLPKDGDTRKGLDILERGERYYNSMADFRKRRKRARNYMRGKQWSDKVYIGTTGDWVTEEEYIKSQGKVPLKNNQIRQVVKSVIGQYRTTETKPIVTAREREDARAEEMMTNALHKTIEVNKSSELDVRNFEEFMLSGAAVCRTTYSYWNDRNMYDVLHENCNMNSMFFNTDLDDFRVENQINFIGRFFDLSLDKVVAKFAKTPKDSEWIKSLYQVDNIDEMPDYVGLSANAKDTINFRYSTDPSKCRVFEIWEQRLEWRLHCHDTLTGKYIITSKKEKDIEAINAERIAQALIQGIPAEDVALIDYEKKPEQIWFVTYLTPWGHILYEGETPYHHETHPFTLILYPLIDGEVWGFVEDIIDQQRYINRMIIMMDFMISASAKGVLLIPEDCLSDDMDYEDVVQEWTKFNGVIRIKLKPGAQIPQQFSSNAMNIGVQEMLALQMKMLQDISGVHGAMQGQSAKSGTAASLYAQEAQNATVNLKDLFETYQNMYLQNRDIKTLKVITQYYNERRNLTFNGMTNKFTDTKFWDPEAIKNQEFDLVIAQSTDTPTYRQIIEESLFKLFEMQAIDLEQYLENSSIPFADKLLDSVRTRKEQMQNGQAGSIDPQMMEQAQVGANPEVVNKLAALMGIAS